MTKTNNHLFIALLMSIVFSSTTMSQQLLELDGEEIILDPNASVVFDALSGKITAMSEDGSLLCSHDGIGSGNGNVPLITGFTATNVNFNGTPQLSWTIANFATSCVKSGGWSGRDFAVDGNGVILNSTGTSAGAAITSSRSYSMHCSNCSGASLIVSTTANIINNDPPTVSLTVNGTSNVSIDDNTAAALAWTIGNANNITCDKIGDWPGTNGTITASGSGNTGLLAVVGSPYTFKLECYNNGDTSNKVSDEVTVTVGSALPASCFDTFDPVNPAGIARDTRNTIYISDGARAALNGVEPQYPQDQNWPALSDPIRTATANNQYIALQFQTDNTDYQLQTMFFKASPITFGPPSSGITYSISECPGDFRSSLGQCAHNTTSQNQFRWSTNGQFTDAEVCNLDKNKTYYFNLIHSKDDYNYTVSTCAIGVPQCGIIILNEQ